MIYNFNKYFESFEDRNLTSIVNYLKNSKQNKDNFIYALKEICKDFNKPLSLIKCKYMPARTARKVCNSIKFWFSLESGYIAATSNNTKSMEKKLTFNLIDVENFHKSYLSDNKILTNKEIDKIKHDYDKGVLIKENLSNLKTGDRVLAKFPNNSLVDSYVYREESNDSFQIHLIQDVYNNVNTNEKILEYISKFGKKFSYRVYRRYKDSYAREYNIAVDVFKYKKTNDELHQDVSNIDPNVLEYANFIKNNIPLFALYSAENRYNDISKSDYALVIDIDTLMELPNINKSNNKPLDRINDPKYRKINTDRWRDKLGRSLNVKNGGKVDIEFFKNYLRYSNMNKNKIINSVLDLYSKGFLSLTDLDILNDIM